MMRCEDPCGFNTVLMEPAVISPLSWVFIVHIHLPYVAFSEFQTTTPSADQYVSLTFGVKSRVQVK